MTDAIFCCKTRSPPSGLHFHGRRIVHVGRDDVHPAHLNHVQQCQRGVQHPKEGLHRDRNDPKDVRLAVARVRLVRGQGEEAIDAVVRDEGEEHRNQAQGNLRELVAVDEDGVRHGQTTVAQVKRDERRRRQHRRLQKGLEDPPRAELVRVRDDVEHERVGEVEQARARHQHEAEVQQPDHLPQLVLQLGDIKVDELQHRGIVVVFPANLHARALGADVQLGQGLPHRLRLLAALPDRLDGLRPAARCRRGAHRHHGDRQAGARGGPAAAPVRVPSPRPHERKKA
mmetsp:Transcript_18132/g.54177  ORF Transcript_18132/g.54177 Transcript_18132/m.54177 type:complete len:285 (-) Transcript_18132:9-863(-)